MTGPAAWHPPAIVGESPSVKGARQLIWFVAMQIICQLLLIAPIGGIHTVVRAASLGGGLVMLLMLPTNARQHPAFGWAMGVMLVLLVSIAHPDSDLPLAAPAQAVLYLAILSPLFWVPRLSVRSDDVLKVFTVLWAFHLVGAVVGVLQVYFPGMLQPPVSPVILSLGPGYVNQLKITVAGGVRIFRPMGLTDVPGGAGASGAYAVLFGVGFFLTSRRKEIVALAIASMLVGMTCLYLSQIRSLLVMTGVSVIVLSSVLVVRRDFKRLGSMSVAIVLLIYLSFRTALSMANQAVTTRVGSLAQGTPHDVYYGSRGQALDYTIDVLVPAHPLGAGLGRWGMMNLYFGNGSPSLWAELQWTAWILDGGILLVVLYVGTIGAVLLTNWRLSHAPVVHEEDSLHIWAAVLLGYGVGIVALTFSYPVFLSQTGMEFWLLSAALWTAERVEREYAEREAADL